MPSDNKPNVLLITVDQWSGRYLGAMGHPCIMTPTLDQLAANGVLFSNCYSAGPVCIPARRALMTGTTPQTHGCNQNMNIPMPDLPTIADVFRQGGYQAYAVGKIHTTPQRDRIGFEDIILNEEGRHTPEMTADDYELYLAEQGYAGQEMTHAMCNNRYLCRPWHLPEHLHPTYWTVREMCKVIRRRDPTRPAFWYMSFNYPHPPLVPPAAYLDLYRDADIPEPFIGDWARDFDALPYALKQKHRVLPTFTPAQLRLARQAYYAQCTYIDHQMRLVIGLLREEGLLDDTILCFTADHGEMLGNHGLYAKSEGFEESAKIPFILVPTAADPHGVGHHGVDGRLAEIRDIMPTLLEMCGLPIPDSVEGLSVLSDQRRQYVHSESGHGARANRMVRDDRYKLHYFPAGNRFLLFDMVEDPDEMRDLSADPSYAQVKQELEEAMVGLFYGTDLNWVKDGRLVGEPEPPFTPGPDRALSGQRGWRFM